MDLWISWENEHLNQSVVGKCLLGSAAIFPGDLILFADLNDNVFWLFLLGYRPSWRCSLAADRCFIVSKRLYLGFLYPVWMIQFKGCVYTHHWYISMWDKHQTSISKLFKLMIWVHYTLCCTVPPFVDQAAVLQRLKCSVNQQIDIHWGALAAVFSPADLLTPHFSPHSTLSQSAPCWPVMTITRWWLWPMSLKILKLLSCKDTSSSNHGGPQIMWVLFRILIFICRQSNHNTQSYVLIVCTCSALGKWLVGGVHLPEK